MSASNFHKLQLVQNILAHVVTGTKKRDHITPVIQAFHWLPVSFRITYKIAIVTYKVKLTRQPEYLSDYIQPLVRSRNLRSSETDLIHIPDSKWAPTNISRRAFSFVAPTIWNSLAIHLRSLVNLKFLDWHTPSDHVTIPEHTIRLTEIDK